MERTGVLEVPEHLPAWMPATTSMWNCTAPVNACSRESVRPMLRPAIVTVLDDAGSLVAKSLRDKTLLLKVKHPDKFVVVDADDRVAASIDCESDPPWQVLDSSGALIGELVAGKPGPTLSPHWSD